MRIVVSVPPPCLFPNTNLHGRVPRYDFATIPGVHAEGLFSRRGTGTAFADDDEGKTKVPNCSLSSRLVRSNRGPVSRSVPARWSPGLMLPVPPRADRDDDRGGEDDSDAEDVVTGARANGWTAGRPSC